ncbi:hypothetical protein B0J17DRAFT_720720 [Rhizoctonia solani]|nr:hypothetical protein B0J17DRAFT_720720 [Rhizoctonia solani]
MMRPHNRRLYRATQPYSTNFRRVFTFEHTFPTYPQDPEYYLNGGNVVLLIEGILFKIDVSILKAEMGSWVFYGPSPVQLLVGRNTQIFGSTNLDPVVVPEIKAQQFRHLLLALLGRPGDPEYMNLLTDAKDSLRHTKETFLKYLDIGYLASRIQLKRLAGWAKEQLLLIFNSTSRVAENIWGADTLLQLATLAASANEEFHSKAHIFLRYSLSPWTVLSIDLCSAFLVDRYILLFKDPAVLETSKELFGWVFLFVLSLGHESKKWREQLALKDRAVLYAAELEMTSLCDYQDLDVAWLLPPNHTAWYLDICCDSCWEHCESTWDSSFGQVGLLDSSMLLSDIRMLLLLPRFRQAFAKAAHSPQWPCKARCGETVLASADQKFTQLCLDMSTVYEDLLR